MSAKTLNRPLLAGLILASLLFAGLAAAYFAAPHDLSDQAKASYTVDESGSGSLQVLPVPPGGDYPFGTDKYGYDLLAKMLAGAPYTIGGALAIAAARTAAGSALGMLLGYYGSNAGHRRLRQGQEQGQKQGQAGSPLAGALNGIPAFVIVWMIMIGISMNPAASPLAMTLMIGAVLTLVGIPPVISTMRAKTGLIKEKAFITAAQSIGAGHGTIVRRHIWPHLKESIAVLFVQEVVLALGLFGQLAIFNVFVGGTTQFFDPVEYVSRSNEWSGLIGQARDNLFVHQWLLLYPLGAYIAFILALYWISIGLEKHYRHKYAKQSLL